MSRRFSGVVGRVFGVVGAFGVGVLVEVLSCVVLVVGSGSVKLVGVSSAGS